jgi:hypothetical protein
MVTLRVNDSRIAEPSMSPLSRHSRARRRTVDRPEYPPALELHDNTDSAEHFGIDEFGG